MVTSPLQWLKRFVASNGRTSDVFEVVEGTLQPWHTFLRVGSTRFMASSSKSKAKCLGPSFYDYLDGLQKEFELTSPKDMRLLFNSYLEGAKCEFELMTGDIKSLQKERDELEIKVEAQAMELRNVRNNILCQRCSKSTARNVASPPLKTSESAPSSGVQSKRLQRPNTSSLVKPLANTSRNVAPFPLNTSSSRPVFQPKSLPKPNTSPRVDEPSQKTLRSSMTVTQKPNTSSAGQPPASTSRKITSSSLKTSGTASSSSSTPASFQPKPPPKPANTFRVVKPSQKLSTQHMTFARKSHTTITPTQPSQSVSDTISRCSNPIVANSPNVTAPSPLPQLTANADSGPEATTTNDIVGTDLRIHTMHTLPHESLIWSVKFSQDGKYLAVGCRDGKAYVYDVQTGTLICVLRNPLAKDDLNGGVCFSRDGKYLATGSSYRGIYIWEINTKYVRNAFKKKTPSIGSLDFSPDGRLLVSVSHSHSVWLWNMRDGAAKELTDGNPKFIHAHYTSAVFSPNGVHVAACSVDGMVRLWHARTGLLMRRVMAHMNYASDVGFTPDGKGLVTGGAIQGAALKYWDISSWIPTLIRGRPQPSHLDDCISASEEQPREYTGHAGYVYGLAISPDGRWIASGSRDNTARIWDICSKVAHCRLDHKRLVYSVDFSPTGHYLASGGADGLVRIWRYSDITPGDNQVHDDIWLTLADERRG